MTVSLTATVGLILATCRRETALLRSSVWLGWLAVAMAIGLPAPVVASIADGASDSEPGITDVHANAKIVPRYEKFELTFRAGGRWSNPFDPAQVAVDCRVEPPEGEPFIVPAFFFQDYVRDEIEGRERLEARGAPVWKVRIAPTRPGTYHYRLRLQNAGRTIEGERGEFTCSGASNRRGFVRIASANPRYLERDDGSTFFVVGEDMLFPGGAGTYEMDKWLTNLSRAGGNFIRTWWCHSTMNLEDRVSAQPRRAFGVYDLESAWRADHQLELSEQLGIAVMPTIETQQ
jgi:hypothetical protein